MRVVVAGGKTWAGSRECDIFARGLVERGVLPEHVPLESESLTTRGSAAGVARLLGPDPKLSLGLVTCDWHMPRALWLFRRYGWRVSPLPADAPAAPLRAELCRRVRERASFALDLLRAPLLVLAILGSFGCTKPSEATKRAPASAAPSVARVPQTSLLDAELRRNAADVSEDELLSEEPRRRAAATRALARIRDPQSFELLLDALSDEAPDVVVWAAFGVGQLCRGREPEAVRRLVLRAATLAAEPEPDRRAPLPSLALALGYCASSEAEHTLRSWLRHEPAIARAAALGLGQIARQRKRLDDVTVAALLDGAASDPSGSFFYPIESLPSLGAAARSRLIEVSESVLDKAGPARGFALRALGRGGADAARLLGAAIGASSTSDSERADAARSLAALGEAGRAELVKALEVRARALIDDKAWLSASHGVVLALLDGVEPGAATTDSLGELATLPLDGEPPPVTRRKVMLRCRAAAVLAGSASASRALLACDPSPPAERREGALAQLRVLGRGPLDGARGRAFRALLASSDRVVREAALELLMAHDEVPGIPDILADALRAPEVGVRATAAKVLARYPARAQLGAEGKAGAGPVAPQVVRALTEQLGSVASPGENLELSALLLDAAASLELLGAKPALERACSSPNPMLRERAERGLVRSGEPERRCPLVVGFGEASTPPDSVKLVFDTDVGPLSLTLAGAESPFATARLLELVKSGFFDGMLVHRVVPGFVVQLGDPDGDGFGGPALPPLRCQTGGEPFETGSVGIALAGRDTGGSQFFVALRRAPHLDGDYSRIGRAEPGWDNLAAGDRIVRARVLDAGAN